MDAVLVAVDFDTGLLCAWKDYKLLGQLLRANLPKFWLPVNKNGHDALHTAAIVKSRQCIKLLLDKINLAKRDGRLARIPEENDRFLRNLLRLTPDFHDLVGQH